MKNKKSEKSVLHGWWYLSLFNTYEIPKGKSKNAEIGLNIPGRKGRVQKGNKTIHTLQ